MLLKGWKYKVFLGSLVGALGVTIYPIIISPVMNPTYYQNVQKVNRKDVTQEDIQPGNMKVWSDPFDRKKPM